MNVIQEEQRRLAVIQVQRKKKVFDQIQAFKNVCDRSPCGTYKTTDLIKWIAKEWGGLVLYLCTEYNNVDNVVHKADKFLLTNFAFRSKYAEDPDNIGSSMCLRKMSERSFPGCRVEITDFSAQELRTLSKYTQRDYHRTDLTFKSVVKSYYECAFYYTCPYQLQQARMEAKLDEIDEDVLSFLLITTVELGMTVYNLCKRYKVKVDLVVYDESFEEKMVKHLANRTKTGDVPLIFTQTELEHYAIMFQQPIQKYYPLDIANITHIHITNPRLYELQSFCDNIDNEHLFAKPTNKRHTQFELSGLWDHFRPQSKGQQFLVLSASCSMDLWKILLPDVTDFKVFYPFLKYPNPVLEVKCENYLHKSSKIFDDLTSLIMDLYSRDPNLKIGFGSKKTQFEAPLKALFPQLYTAHYKQKGIDALPEEVPLDLLILFCGYADRPDVIFEFGLLGFTESQIIQFKKSTTQQMVGRFRLHNRPETPVITLLPHGMLSEFQPSMTLQVPMDEFKHYMKSPHDNPFTEVSKWVDQYIFHLVPLPQRIGGVLSQKTPSTQVARQLGCSRQYVNRVKKHV